MMSTDPLPSVLIVRSSCLPLENDDVESSSTTTTDGTTGSTTTLDRVGTNNHDTDALLEERKAALDHLQKATPLSCDITILPELPNNNAERAKNNTRTTAAAHKDPPQQYIRMLQQVLNPCGTDNVFLLPDLPHSSADAVGSSSSGFLLSMTACKAIVTTTEADNAAGTTNNNATKDDNDDKVVLETLSFPVQAIPSTFSFHFDDDTTKSDGSIIQQMEHHQKGIKTSQGASATLDVAFDFAGAREHLLTTMFLKTNVGKHNSNNNDDDVASTPPDVVVVESDLGLQSEESHGTTPESKHDVVLPPDLHKREPINNRFNATQSHNHQQLLLLQTMFEKEANDLNAILSCLGFVGILLSAVYLWMAFHLVHESKTRHKKHHGADKASAENTANQTSHPSREASLPRQASGTNGTDESSSGDDLFHQSVWDYTKAKISGWLESLGSMFDYKGRVNNEEQLPSGSLKDQALAVFGWQRVDDEDQLGLGDTTAKEPRPPMDTVTLLNLRATPDIKSRDIGHKTSSSWHYLSESSSIAGLTDTLSLSAGSVVPGVNGTKEGQIMATVSPKHKSSSSLDGHFFGNNNTTTEKQLSPCSRLAREWERSKDIRRGSRKSGRGGGILPTKNVVQSPSSVPLNPSSRRHSITKSDDLSSAEDNTHARAMTMDQSEKPQSLKDDYNKTVSSPTKSLPTGKAVEDDVRPTVSSSSGDSMLRDDMSTVPQVESHQNNTTFPALSPKTDIADSFIEDYWGKRYARIYTSK